MLIPTPTSARSNWRWAVLDEAEKHINQASPLRRMTPMQFRCWAT